MTLYLALSSHVIAAPTHVSRDEAIRIARAKVMHTFAKSPWHYRYVGASYIREDHEWVVFFRETRSRSRCTVEVDDRTGRSLVIMP